MAGRVSASHEYGQQRIAPQFVVIVDVFIAQAEAVDALRQQFFGREFDQFGIAMISKAGGESTDDARPLFDFPQ
ncbi:MAG TPA: hypothetical protein VGN42_07170 [Pirellulales bacterium]|nr:hypothetical protein [Pirellulales bacterium]